MTKILKPSPFPSASLIAEAMGDDAAAFKSQRGGGKLVDSTPAAYGDMGGTLKTRLNLARNSVLSEGYKARFGTRDIAPDVTVDDLFWGVEDEYQETMKAEKAMARREARKLARAA